MADLPCGTVTFLFTDIEGSTRLWEQHPEAMRGALARHDALAAALVEGHAGTLVMSRGEGDSLFAVFARASDALAAACAFQQALVAEPWPPEISLRVRMALHTGEADLRDGSYYGSEVNRCARLRAVAHGGQVLLTRTTYDLVRDARPEGAGLRDLGQQRLRDLARPEQIFQLLHPALRADFPPLRSLEAFRHNLPVQRTQLLGREESVAALQELLLRGDAGLVTLTGPGGSGKTRLGLQVAAELLDQFEDGVFLVELEPVQEPSLVASNIAQELGVRETGGQPLLESLKEYLRNRQLLLLLDNFEQVLPAAPLVAELLAAASRLKVLVTSRASLRLRGEKEYPVLPLALPDRKQLPPAETLSQYAAVALFVQRALDLKPDFAVTNENAPAVAEICHRLDGLPLAIELAAARCKLLSPQALLLRLESRLKLLTGGARDLPARQQTLRGAIAWSHELLDESDKILFRRLGVFAGGASLDAVEAVCGADGSLERDVLDGVASLVDKSLLRQEENPAGEPRLTMLETIREYALECLAASGEEALVRRQHALFFAMLAEEAEPQLESREQGAWIARLNGEHDNFRAALQWCQQQEPEFALRLAGALAEYWHLSGDWREGRQWLMGVLAQTSSSLHPLARARALTGAGVIAWELEQLATSRTLLEEGVALWRELGDRRGLGRALTHLGWTVYGQQDPSTARTLLEESRSILQEEQDLWGLTPALRCLARISLNQEDRVGARVLWEESLAITRRIGDVRGVALSLSNLGELADLEGNRAAASALWEEALSLRRNSGDQTGTAFTLNTLAQMASWRADRRIAYSRWDEALRIFRELGNDRGTANVLFWIALAARDEGDYQRACSFYEQALAVWREAGDALGIAHILNDLGYVAYLQGDLERARALLEESLATPREPYETFVKGWTLAHLGEVADAQGDHRASQLLFDESIAIWKESRNRHGVAYVLHKMARAAQHRGDHDQMGTRYRESLALWRDLDHKEGIAECLEGLAESAGTAPEAAARLLGAAEALREAIQRPLPPVWQPEYEEAVAGLRAALGEERFAAARAQGRAMPLEQAIDYALEEGGSV